MDVVYTLGTGSKYNNFELKMSLRSIEKNLKGFDQVWIVGECPAWIKNVNHILHPDNHSIPDWNIADKITVYCNQPEGSEDFFFINDDHYLMHEFEVSEFPYYHAGTLDDYVKKRSNDGYGRRASNTLKHLKSNGLPSKYFDIHYPIIYNKKIFIEIVSKLPWDATEDGFIIKSLYGNSIKAEGINVVIDNKSTSTPQPNVKVYSSMPFMKKAIQRFLLEQFPKKSRFEL